MSAIISGDSALDLGRLNFFDDREVTHFLEAYGFDPRTAEGRREMEKIVPLALTFMAEELFPVGEYDRIPDELPRDPISLLKLASQVSNPMRSWACAVLRVCHAVAHGIYLPGRDRVAEACAQLEDRFRPHLKVEGGSLQLGDIPLIRCDFKAEKPWNSLLLKLLCKKDSVAEEIYDQVGVRIVTRSRADTLLVVRYLIDENVVLFPNIKPSRSYNTLVDLNEFRNFVAQAKHDWEKGFTDASTFEERVQSYAGETAISPDAVRNPYSDDHYRSIQFTARIMIHRNRDDGSVERFFFPFELQLMDEVAYRRNMYGKSNHHAYRERQRVDARRRVFPWAMPSIVHHAAIAADLADGDQPFAVSTSLDLWAMESMKSVDAPSEKPDPPLT